MKRFVAALALCLAGAAAYAGDLRTSDPPGLTSCSAAGCAAEQATLRTCLRQAYEGKKHCQRLLADYYRDGCEGALSKTPLLACAWRRVLAATPGPGVLPRDGDDRARDCAEFAAGTAQQAAQAEFAWLFSLMTKLSAPE